MGQLEDMDTFIRIVEAGGIGRAADHLGVAKSAVSRRLVDLEARLGVQLLQRTTRQSNLTEAGRAYYQQARQIVADVDELNSATSNVKTVLRGDLKIATPLSFGLLHLSPAIIEFAAIHPDLNIHLDFSDRHVDLLEEGLDMAVRIADLDDSSLIARKLAPVSNILCASPSYLETAGRPRVPRDLRSHKILHYGRAATALWRFVNPDSTREGVRLRVSMSANNGDYLGEAAAAGLGVARLPTFLVYEKIETGQLVRVLADHVVPPITAYAVYPSTRHLSQRVRTFIDFLVDRFSGEPYWDQPHPSDNSELRKHSC